MRKRPHARGIAPRWTALVTLATLAACDGSTPPPAPPASEDAPTPDGCATPDAWTAAGRDPCELAAWGALSEETEAIYVCTAGRDDGAGSLEDPIATIGRALERAVEDGRPAVALALGRYDESLVLDAAVDGLALRGACRDGVELRADEATADYQDAVLAFVPDRSDARLELGSLTVRGAETTLGVMTGALTLRDVAVAGGEQVGLYALAGAQVRLESTRVEAPLDADSQHILLAVESGAQVEGAELELLGRDWTTLAQVGNAIAGTSDARLSVQGCVARFERGACDGCGALGFVVDEERLALSDCAVQGVPAVAVFGSGASLELRRTTIHDTVGGDLEVLGASGATAGIAQGAIVALGSTITLEDVAVERAQSTGLMLEQTTLAATGLRVLDTQPGGLGGEGIGLAAVTSDVALTASEVDGAIGVGIGLANGGALELDDVVVRRVAELDDAASGTAVSVGTDSTLRASGLRVEQAAYIGIDLRRLGAPASLDDVEILDVVGTSADIGGVGLNVQEGAVAEVRDLVIEGAARTALAVSADATIVVEGGHIGGTSGAGSGSWAVLVTPCLTSACVEAGEGPSCCGAAGASAALHGVDVVDSADVAVGAIGAGAWIGLDTSRIEGVAPGPGRQDARGLVLGDGARGELYDVSLADIGAVGVLVHGATLEWTVGALTGTWETGENTVAVGLGVQDGATATLHEVQIRDTEGPGMFLHTATASVDTVDLHDNQFAGAAVVGAALHARALSVQGTVDHGALGGGVGILAHASGDAAPAVDLVEAQVQDNAMAAVYLVDPGAVSIDASALHGGPGAALTEGGSVRVHGNAVFLRGGDARSQLCVQDSTLHGSAVALLADEADAEVSVCSLLSNSFTDNDTDVLLQPCALDGDGPTVDWPGAITCPSWSLPTTGLVMDLDLDEPAIDRGLEETWSP